MTVLRAALLFDHPTTRLFVSRILESFFFSLSFLFLLFSSPSSPQSLSSACPSIPRFTVSFSPQSPPPRSPPPPPPSSLTYTMFRVFFLAAHLDPPLPPPRPLVHPEPLSPPLSPFWIHCKQTHERKREESKSFLTRLFSSSSLLRFFPILSLFFLLLSSPLPLPLVSPITLAELSGRTWPANRWDHLYIGGIKLSRRIEWGMGRLAAACFVGFGSVIKYRIFFSTIVFFYFFFFFFPLKSLLHLI